MSLRVCDGFRCCISPPPAVLRLSVYCWFKCKPKHVGDFNYFNKLKFYSVIRKSVHVLVIIENMDNMHGEKLKICSYLLC